MLMLHVTGEPFGRDAVRALDRTIAERRPSAVILDVGSSSANSLAEAVRAVQRHDIAALLFDAYQMAHDIGADGVHLGPRDDALAVYQAARARLGAMANIGVDAGSSRHTAMEVAEAGADYIAFGHAAVEAEARDELVGWWADVFEVPCVALDVESDADAERLIASGADFVVRKVVLGE